MAKSKEQKQQEAIQRKRESYFEHKLVHFVKCMPGGEFFGTDPRSREILYTRTNSLIKATREAMVNVQGDPVAYSGMHVWDAEQVIRFYLHRDNYLQMLNEAQQNFNETVRTGELPFRPNRQRFDSDMASLREIFGVTDV